MGNFTLPGLLDLDAIFHSRPESILVNDFVADARVETVVSHICAENGEAINIASCECGELTGNRVVGVTCSACGTVAREFATSDVVNNVWMSVPEEIGYVLNPAMYRILKRWMKKNSAGVSTLEALLDPTLELGDEHKDVIHQQGMRYFYDNFDAIINYFAYVNKKTKSNRDIRDSILMILKLYGHRIWCSKLPLLNRELNPIIVSPNGKKNVDQSITSLVNLVIKLADALLVNQMEAASVPHILKKFPSVYFDYIEFTKTLQSSRLFKKKCLFRQHVFGTRMTMTFRGVIVPIVGIHQGDEIHVPWRIGLINFRYHIINHLVNRHGYTVNDANMLINNSVGQYNWLLDKIMQRIIAECPYFGYPCLFNRNPSVRTGSVQLRFITKVKPAYSKDPKLDGLDKYKHVADQTIAISPLVLHDFNADFDGDEMNALTIVEMDMVNELMTMHPKTYMIDMVGCTMGGAVSLTNQQAVSLDMWANA